MPAFFLQIFLSWRQILFDNRFHLQAFTPLCVVCKRLPIEIKHIIPPNSNLRPRFLVRPDHSFRGSAIRIMNPSIKFLTCQPI